MSLDGSEGTYTAAEVATLLKCSLRHLRHMDERQLVPGRLRLGRLIRFSKRAIHAWINGIKPTVGNQSTIELSETAVPPYVIGGEQ